MTRQFAITCSGSLALLLAGGAAQASCGSAFCVLNTNWSTQGIAADPGTARLDLRYEFVDQKHLQSGARRISTDDPAVAAEDTTELRTINRNLLTTLDYTFSKNWAVSVSVPVVGRSHSHIDNATGENEKWDFTKISDTRVLGSYRFDNENNPVVNYGLTFGVKLPTGDYKVMNGDGVAAERSLQPGTGSTDAVLGGYYSAPGIHQDSSWWAQVLVQWAASTRDEFKPGNQYQINLGYRHPFTDALQGLLQLNSVVKERDGGGVNAEPDLSGSKVMFLSPGLSYSITRDTQIYSFVQLPIYRYYNGIQLSVDWAFVAGATLRF